MNAVEPPCAGSVGRGLPLFSSLALLILALGNGLCASASPLPQEALQTTADLVKVDVSVADQHGKFQADLTRDNFRILDNGAEQPAVFFTPAETPSEILVMIETGPAVYLISNEHLTAAYALVNGLNPGDRVALVAYDQSPRQILAFTADKNLLLSALGEVQYNLGRADLNLCESLSQVLDWMKPIPGKRAVVLLSTGLDSSSAAQWEALAAKLHRDDVVIFPVALGGSLRASSATKRPKNKKDARQNRSGGNDPSSLAESPVSFARADRDLRALAAITGGRAYFPDSGEEFLSIYREIAAALGHQYVLGFVPSHDGLYHSLRLELKNGPGPGGRGPDYQVLARAGYLAPGP
jgi:Ca-activated chloride channel family protein